MLLLTVLCNNIRSIASYNLNMRHVVATTALSTRGGSNHCNYCRRTTIQTSSLYSSPVAARRTKTQLYSRKSSSSSTTKQQLKTIEGNDIYAAEQVIKKSRFIGLATHCTSWDDAQSIIEDIRKEHPKSRHVCFGFVSSSEDGGAGTQRASDDGEPTGKSSGLWLIVFSCLCMRLTSEQYVSSYTRNRRRADPWIYQWERVIRCTCCSGTIFWRD